jgi:hypothetical protein
VSVTTPTRSIVFDAGELHEILQQAERSFERSGASSAVHDLYVRTYVEAIANERHQRREREARS